MSTCLQFLKFLVLTCLIVIQLSNAEFNCTTAGKFIHSESRSKYHECHLVGNNQFSYFLQECPKDTCFDGADLTCNPFHCESEMMQESGTPPEEATFFRCPAPGKFSHVDPSRKEAYYKCVDANGLLYLYEYQCLPTKPCFSARKQACHVC